MKYLGLFFNAGNVIGFALLVLGFFLIPIFVGVPIFILGILILVFNFYKKWINIFIPENTQEQIKSELKKSYEPYQPAIKSMRFIGKDIIRTSLIVFIILVVLIVVFLIK